MADNKIAEILYRQLQDALSHEEVQLLEDWKKSSPNNMFLAEEINSEQALSEMISEYHPDNKLQLRNRIFDNVSSQIKALNPSRRKILWLRWGMAASIAIIFSLATVVYFSVKKEKPIVSIPAQNAPDIQPGKDGAILTLADGSQVVLDSVGNGVISINNDLKATVKDGQLVYDPARKSENITEYNLMQTPRGRQFKLLLPDGTQVWLNAASSIRFPTVFAGNERIVEISGEAYLDVAPDPNMPFKVKVNDDMQVNVLGTEFNISAYENENSINTTLISGAIKVNETVLKQGQQAQVSRSTQNQPSKVKLINNANLEKVVAWKNGLFNFEGLTFKEVMNQLERWYDIDVEYERGVPDINFWGEMSRDVSLKGLLIVLEKSEVRFRLEGRKLIVLP